MRMKIPFSRRRAKRRVYTGGTYLYSFLEKLACIVLAFGRSLRINQLNLSANAQDIIRDIASAC
jgi:hypothetical protein